MHAYSSEQLVGRFEDQRDVKNLMAKIGYSIMLKQEDAIVSRFWSGRDDICLGVNDGYYSGSEAVRGYYDAVAAHTAETTAFLKSAFPDRMDKLTEQEQYGAGSMDTFPMSTPVVEIAEDGATAKGIWYARGTSCRITEQGPVAYWILGVYACDFVRENGAWKIWHMLNLEDVVCPCGRDWSSSGGEPFPDIPAFAGARPFVAPIPNVPKLLHREYRPGRPFMPLPEPPVPYHTFAETFSYGCEKEAQG